MKKEDVKEVFSRVLQKIKEQIKFFLETVVLNKCLNYG